jgi:hypothetical protein
MTELRALFCRHRQDDDKYWQPACHRLIYYANATKRLNIQTAARSAIQQHMWHRIHNPLHLTLAMPVATCQLTIHKVLTGRN